MAACGAATPARKDLPTRPITRDAFSFLAYAGTLPAEQSALVDAEALLKARCMAGAGFRFYGGAPGASPGASSATRLYTYSGRPPSETANLDARERYGYGLSAVYSPAGQQAASGGPGPAFDRWYVQQLSRAEQARYAATLGGSPKVRQGVLHVYTLVISYSRDGCQAKADRDLYGSVVADLRAMAVGEYAFERVSSEAAAETRASAARWSDCVLKATGKRFANPNQAVQDAQMLYERDGDTPGVRLFERTVATRDGRCEYQSGLAAQYSATFRRLAGALPPAVIEAIASADAVDRIAFERATSILRKAGPEGRKSLSPPSSPAPANQSTTPIQIGSPPQTPTA